MVSVVWTLSFTACAVHPSKQKPEGNLGTSHCPSWARLTARRPHSIQVPDESGDFSIRVGLGLRSDSASSKAAFLSLFLCMGNGMGVTAPVCKERAL